MAQPNVQAQLSDRNGRAAVDLYRAAFGVEDESPPFGNFSPPSLGGATTRALLLVEDPEAVLERAVADGRHHA